MSQIRLVSLGKHLASRERARQLREGALSELGSGHNQITIDFEGVDLLSDSFADELLAILVRDKGEEWFRNHVRLLNLQDEMRTTILRVIQFRLESNNANA